MECPRCRLFNPPEAQRCDCGYDFTTRTIEKAYYKQEFPSGLKTALIIFIFWNLLATGIALTMAGDVTRFIVTVGVSIVAWAFYVLTVLKEYWAWIALIIVTFPIGLAFLGMSREIKVYCLQTKQ